MSKLSSQMSQNVQISTTFNINTESIQIDELSLFNESTVLQTTIIERTTPQITASETFITPNPSVNDEIANKRTIIESKTPQRSTSDTFTTPKPSVNDENKLIKSTRSSKIPTIKKSFVITPKTETKLGLNLCPRIGPNRKSILPVAK